VKDLFAAVIAAAPTDRAALLDDECRDDPELRARLDALLAAHDQPRSDLNRPLAGPARTEVHATAAGADAVVAGRYKLRELIGEGGMSEVWVADQLEPVRCRVALKMIKPGMDSEQVLARFEAERQAIALMDHPNIARVLDTGTAADGRPFFAMELVKGVPVTEFCDARKLTPRERLELFIPVCEAVQHAHTKGIIHRDVKPSNVLVALHDERPVPKVIDFGVAKAHGQRLTEKTIYTGFGALVGNPAYMAPEQATFSQLDVVTRADVYALVVLLYELLAGSPPFEPERLKQVALDEVLRVVREEEPPRPSTRLSTSEARATIAAVRKSDPVELANLMRGELDWVVMKALEKDRARRYETAAALARDVGRYLKDEAVEACPPTLGYRVRKLYRRHRAAVLTAAGFALLLVAGAAAAGWLEVQATDAEHATAEERDRTAEQRDAAARQRDAARIAEKDAAKQRDETAAAHKRLQKAQDDILAAQYAWDMQTVPGAWQAGNVLHARQLLDRHAPALRRFEWHYWDRQLNSERRTNRLQVTGKGTHAGWTVSSDRTRVRAPGPAAGQPVRRPRPPADRPAAGPTLQVWDTADGRLVLTHAMTSTFARGSVLTRADGNLPRLSPDGRRVAAVWEFSDLTPTAEGGGFERVRYHLQVIDVASRKVLLDVTDWRSGTAPAGAFSRGGRLFAANGRATDRRAGPWAVKVWDLDAGGKELCSVSGATVSDAPFTPDGSRLVGYTSRVAGETGKGTKNQPGRVCEWDTATGKEAAGWDIDAAHLGPPVCSPADTWVSAVTSAGGTAARSPSTSGTRRRAPRSAPSPYRGRTQWSSPATSRSSARTGKSWRSYCTTPRGNGTVSGSSRSRPSTRPAGSGCSPCSCRTGPTRSRG
jgi:tRNA A-37 threonylcarbamoyl transferase component Bud32